MSAAAEIVGRLAERQPDVVRLARAASLAARIEPGLLRHLRIELLPASDAGLEADLRFSPLTHSHNVSSIVLRSELIELLREDLAAPANRPLLDRAWQIVQAKHSSAPSIIQLEERVTWLALCAETSAIDLETELMRAVRALAHQDRTGIAQWAARALPRLPARARRTEAEWLLAVSAAAHLGGREILDPSAAMNVSAEMLRAVLPAETNTVHIGARLLENGIEFGDVGLPGAKLLRVPNASPVTLDVYWELEGDELITKDGILGELDRDKWYRPSRTIRAVFSLGSRKTFTAPGALRGDDPGKFIYFSYCLQDRDAAQHVADTLKSHGAAAWIDLELREGNVWPVAITQKIESASLIVIVMSRAALSPGPGPIKRKSLQDASID